MASGVNGVNGVKSILPQIGQLDISHYVFGISEAESCGGGKIQSPKRRFMAVNGVETPDLRVNVSQNGAMVHVGNGEQAELNEIKVVLVSKMVQ